MQAVCQLLLHFRCSLYQTCAPRTKKSCNPKYSISIQRWCKFTAILQLENDANQLVVKYSLRELVHITHHTISRLLSTYQHSATLNDWNDVEQVFFKICSLARLTRKADFAVVNSVVFSAVIRLAWRERIRNTRITHDFPDFKTEYSTKMPQRQSYGRRALPLVSAKKNAATMSPYFQMINYKTNFWLHQQQDWIGVLIITNTEE